jgi:hypothetical protein
VRVASTRRSAPEKLLTENPLEALSGFASHPFPEVPQGLRGSWRKPLSCCPCKSHFLSAIPMYQNEEFYCWLCVLALLWERACPRWAEVRREIMKKGLPFRKPFLVFSGGAGRDRTDDLMNGIF